MPMLVSASTSKVLCDGKPIEGIQELQFKITRNRANVHTVGSHERLSGYLGALYVECVLKVRSSFDELDKKMYETIDGIKPFQIVVQLGTQGKGDPVKQISFDDCVLENKSLGMDATGVAVTTYSISAKSAKEE
jgi:hypothetical protein